MQFSLPILRIGSYAALAFFSFLVFCLSAARLNYTNGFGFYETVVPELLVSALFTIPFSLFIIFAIHKRFEHPYFGIFAAEIAGLVILWFFWIIGAGVATTVLGPGTTCTLSACSVVSALLAFSWLSWITLTGILAFVILFCFANSAFKEPLHGRWDPRQSMAVKV